MSRLPQTVGRVILLFAVAILLFAAGATIAMGAPATFGPTVIRQFGFEGAANDTFPSITPYPATPNDGFLATSAYWGSTTATKHSGSASLWCAGTSVPAGHNYWPKYPTGTRGYVTLPLPELADYYSSSVKFWYLMPTLGGEDIGDHPSLALEVSNPTESLHTVVHNIPLTSSWTAYTRTMSSPTYGTNFNASRQSTVFKLSFFDYVENSGEAPNGQGPAVDDFQILGYKYGPPRTFGVASDGGGHAVLTWSAPAMSTGTTTADNRAITYRVWRTEAGQDLWMELTSGRLSATTFTDFNATPGLSYQYEVQVWDDGTGAGYGEIPAAVTFPTVSTKVTAPSAPPSVRTWKTYAVSGGITPAPSGTATVGIELSRDKSTIATPVVASVTSGKYNGTVQFPQPGTWYIRAKYVDASHMVVNSPWGTVSSSSAVTISAPSVKKTMTLNKVYTVTGSVSPAQTSTKYLKVYAYRYSGTTKVQTLSFSVKVSSSGMPAGTTKYSASVKLTKKGTWKLRAEHLSHGTNPVEGTTWSSYSSKVTVK